MPAEPAPRPLATWQSAEEAAAEWMRYWGYPDARLTGGSADAGLDVVAHGAVAQVKWHAKPTGREDLQRLVGANPHPGNTVLFFVASGYSGKAVEYADQRGVALFTFDPWGRPGAVNAAAGQIVEASPARRAEVAAAQAYAAERGRLLEEQTHAAAQAAREQAATREAAAQARAHARQVAREQRGEWPGRLISSAARSYASDRAARRALRADFAKERAARVTWRREFAAGQGRTAAWLAQWRAAWPALLERVPYPAGDQRPKWKIAAARHWRLIVGLLLLGCIPVGIADIVKPPPGNNAAEAAVTLLIVIAGGIWLPYTWVVGRLHDHAIRRHLDRDFPSPGSRPG